MRWRIFPLLFGWFAVIAVSPVRAFGPDAISLVVRAAVESLPEDTGKFFQQRVVAIASVAQAPLYEIPLETGWYNYLEHANGGYQRAFLDAMTQARGTRTRPTDFYSIMDRLDLRRLGSERLIPLSKLNDYVGGMPANQESFDKKYSELGRLSIGTLNYQLEAKYLELVEALRKGGAEAQIHAAGRLATVVALLHSPFHQTYYFKGVPGKNPADFSPPYTDFSSRFGNALITANLSGWEEKLKNTYLKPRELNIPSLNREVLRLSESSYRLLGPMMEDDARFFQEEGAGGIIDWNEYIRKMDEKHGDTLYGNLQSAAQWLTNLYATALRKSRP